MNIIKMGNQATHAGSDTPLPNPRFFSLAGFSVYLSRGKGALDHVLSFLSYSHFFLLIPAMVS